MASIDKNVYREIGELSSNRDDVVVGNIKNTNGSYKNKSLLSPDSDRLLYNYASDVNVRDHAIVLGTENRKEKQFFVGKNIFTIYDTENGSFYVENPRKILSKLMDSRENGGLGLSFEELCSACENMKYVIAVDALAYIFTSTSLGKKIMFAFDPYTYELSLPSLQPFENFIGSSTIYSKPFEYNKRIHILVSKNTGLEAYVFNTYNGDFSKHVDFSTTLNSFYTAGAKTENSLISFKDSANNRLYFIGCVNTASILCYDYANSIWKTLTDNNLGISGRHIIQSAIYAVTGSRSDMVLLLDNNSALFLGIRAAASSSSVLSSKYTFNRTYGVTAFMKCLISENGYGFYFVVKQSDGTSTAIHEAESAIVSNKTIDVAAEIYNTKVPSFIDSISDNVVISGNYFTTSDFNLVYGSYREAGATLPLIKDFGTVVRNLPDIEENRMFRTVDSKDSGIVLTKGTSYGEAQMARVRLYPETVLLESTVQVPDNAKISLRENDTDVTEYTTGSYIWEVLKSTGMPYNTHVEAVGRIVVDGYDIPIEKVMITKAASGEMFGDVLFTFDKMYDIIKIKDNLSDGISSYPGVLFFKNNGFLQNAIISNSHLLNGSLFYDDTSNGRLFDSGIVSIICSCRLEDGNILLGTNFGAIASVNIQTGGYTSVNGESSGDNPPPYFRGMDDYMTYGCIVGIVNHKNKVFAIYSSGAVFRTTVGSNTWVNVKPIDTDEDITWKKAYVQHDNLLIVSKNHGKLYRMDLDTETYIDDTSATKSIDAVASTDPCCQIQLGHRVYYLPLTWRTANNPFSLNHLYWFDANVCIFGKDDSFEFEQGAMLLTDGRYIYVISDKSGTSTTFLRYDPETSEVKRLADLPTSNITRSGGFHKNDSLYIPFGMVDTVWYLLEYNIVNDTWILHNVGVNTSELNIDGNYLIWKNSKGEKIFSQIYGLNSVSNRNKTVSYGILADYAMSINIDALQIEKTVSIVGGQSRFYGAMLAYDNVNRNITLFGGTKYLTSTTTENHSTTVEIYNIDTVSLVKSFTVDVSQRYNNSIIFANCSSIYHTSSVMTAGMYAACMFLRLADTHSVSASDFHLGEFDTESVWYDKPISSMYIEHQNSNTSDRRLLVISYCDGTVATMNASTFRNLNTMAIQNNHPTTGHYNVQKYPPRSRSAILASSGEVSFDGATSIKKIGDDIYFYTPSHTFRWSTLVGAWFHKGCGDDRDLEKADTRVTDLKPWSLYTKKHIAGSSKCMVGKYIVFCNGYDPAKSLMPSKTNVPGRHIVAYDTEFDEFSIIAEAKNDSDISGTVYKKSNAYAYYRDGYIYQLGGNKWSTEYINASGATDTLENPTIRVERYDLVTGTTMNSMSYSKTVAFSDTLRSVDGLYYPVYTNSKIKWLIDTSIVTPCSLSKLCTVDLNDDAVYKNRYRVHISTGLNRTDYHTVPAKNGSNIQVSSFGGAFADPGTTTASYDETESCVKLSVYDTYTEARVIYDDYLHSDIYSYTTDATKWEYGNVSGGTICDVLKVNVPAVCVERYKDGGNICELYCVQENKLYLLKLESDPTAKGRDTSSIKYKKKISCTLVSTAPYDIITKQSICEPFYDEELDAIVVEGVYKDRSTLEKVTMIYSFETKEWKEIRNLNSGLFTPDTNTTPLNRLMPHLEDDKGNLYYVDDINYIVKKEKRSDIVAAYNEDISRTPMFELFMSGVEDSSIPNAVKSTQIVSLGNCFYKGVLIYKGNTDYDSDHALGTKGKTRFVVLKFDSVTKEISVAGIDYPTGTWTAKTNNPIVKTFVCNDMVWFLPKLGTVTGETTSSIPSIAYSFNPDDLTLAKHNIEGENIPSGIPNSSIVSDYTNKCAHVLYCTGGNATEGYGLKDLRLSGLTKLSHIDSSAIVLDVVSEKEPNTIDKKAIPYGSVDYETGEMQIIIQTLHKTDSGISSIAGVKYIKTDNDGLLFNDGDEVTSSLVYNISPYKGSHDVETDLGTIYIAGDKIITQHSGPKFRVYNKSFETLALYSHKSTSDSGTTYTYPRNVMFTQDKVIFVEDVSDEKAKVSMYDINPIPEYKEIKSVKREVYMNDYTSATSVEKYVASSGDIIRHWDEENALIYSANKKKLYVFNTVDRMNKEWMDLSNLNLGTISAIAVDGKKIALVGVNKLHIVDMSTKCVERTISVAGGIKYACMSSDNIFLYSDTTNKVYRFGKTDLELKSEISVSPVDIKFGCMEYEPMNDTVYLVLMNSSNVVTRCKIRNDTVDTLSNTIELKKYDFDILLNGVSYDKGNILLTICAVASSPYASPAVFEVGGSIINGDTLRSANVVDNENVVLQYFTLFTNEFYHTQGGNVYLTAPNTVVVSGKYILVSDNSDSVILANNTISNANAPATSIEEDPDYIFHFNGNVYNIIGDVIYTDNSVYMNLSDVIQGSICGIKFSPNGVLTLLVIKYIDDSSLLVNLVSCDIATKVVLDNKNVTVSGFTNLTTSYKISSEPLFTSNKVIFSVIDKSSNQTDRYPYSVSVDMVKSTALVIKTDSAATANSMLKGLDKVQFFGEDVVSAGGLTVETSDGTMPVLSGHVSHNKRTLVDMISDQGTLQVNDMSHAALLKSGSRLLSVSAYAREVHFDRSGNSMSNQTSVISGFTNSQVDDIIRYASGQLLRYDHFTLNADTAEKARNVPRYMPLENDVFVVKDASGPYRAIRIPKSPITEFIHGDYGVKIYSGSTSDLFVTYDLETKEIVDRLQTERGYGLSITDVNISDDVTLIFYENSPNISSLLIHDNGTITVKLFDGRVLGREIGDADNELSVQELDLTMIFDSESSEFGMRS